jgi:hypothetical protein
MALNDWRGAAAPALLFIVSASHLAAQPSRSLPFRHEVLTVTADRYDDLIIGSRAGGATLAWSLRPLGPRGLGSAHS